ncbi:MAG: type 2 isopentenyl-diphosphate Delta-isomerase [Candidatus Thermoplasmatota archaeon]|jgi:isopentenyl-diphosphate delta-isomerase|nr:type 2 isopentenyl-diphosphate Delta-isomerase [Candidatus Thermoplasmatota archaeon]
MIEQRKEEHIRIAENERVISEHNFWDDIQFVHYALPEIDFEQIDCSINLLSAKLDYPIIISSMTGGTQLAKKINRNLAAAAEKLHLAMGVGSMRAAIEKPELSDTFSVISEFKIPFKLANIGAPQLINQSKNAFGSGEIEKAITMIEADALYIHLNFLQEMIQPEGDRRAKGILKRISEIASSFPVIVKETGNGISREIALELKDAGVKGIDVGGLGGTSFAAIEYYRAKIINDEEKMNSGNTFWNWGIPSPASIVYCQVGLPVIGSGGLRNGLDLARAISMGAVAGGFARTLLKNADDSEDSVVKNLSLIIRDLKIAMFLTRSKTVNDLKKARKVIVDPLKPWIDLHA